MTSLGTDFETHAIWQEYIEDLAAKDFVTRKARTIALSKAQGSCHKTSNNQPYSQVWKSLGDSIPELYCILLRSLARPRSCRKVSVWGFLWERKVWIVFSPTDVCTRNPWQKAEKGRFTGSEVTTRFPWAFCFKKPTCSVPETWGCMYKVLAWSANGTRNGTRNWIPRAAEKGAKKLVSSNFAKILE